MFYIHQSNLLEILAAQLSDILATDSGSNPFVAEQVLVQSPGMSQWLKIYLAKQLGVMANCDFPLPSSYIWGLYQKLFDDLPEQSAFNKQDMTWKLYAILPKFLDDDVFLPLKAYLANDKDGLMLYQLCEKIADVFDQYLMYRPDWIETWEADEDEIKDGDIKLHPWQSILWRALKDHTESIGQSAYHRANLHELMLEKLKSETVVEQAQLPKRMFIFGISALPSQQLDIFEHMAEHMDIHLMLFNPCLHYWGDIVDEKQLAKVEARFKGKRHYGVGEDNYLTVGNPLLASWGKLGRDYLEQLLEIPASQQDYFIEPPARHVLSTIQADVFHLTYREQMEPLSPEETLSDIGKASLSQDDSSLVFHSCHSPLREVEVLHDQLLKLFEQDKTLTPKDVIVMMPDVSAYSPYIDAVFLSSGQNRIPYAISDRGFALENPIINSFLQLMKLPQSRFCASELLDLISVPATINALGLLEQDIDLIHHWIEKVGIRWGIDTEHKGSFKLPSDELNSWRFGLNRLLLGYSIGDEHLVDGILPYCEVEGQVVEILGKLVRFMDILIDFRHQLAQPATLADKAQIVNQLLEQFYLPDAAELQVVNQIREALVNVTEHQHNGNCTEAVSQTVFTYWLSHAFDEKGVGQRFLAGQVNFCTLMPMRSIPFKVICLLGMNDADYPRFVAPIGFDLMAGGKARKGDRSRRLDDRYLLLEALLSAREKLYVSFIGRSISDNSEKLPSVLVTELLEYCKQRFTGGEDKTWITQHPLQPFNNAYFKKDSALFSYQAHWYRYVNHQAGQDNGKVWEPIEQMDALEELELSQLHKFMLHPVRYFFNHTLQLHFSHMSEAQLDDEIFALDALSRYQLLEKLTEEKLKNSGKDSYEQISAGGALPHREVGQIAFDELNQQAESFVATLKQSDMNFRKPVEINLAVDGLSLLGWVKELTSKGLLYYRPAKINAKDRLSAWLQHVVMNAAGHQVPTRHFGLGETLEFKGLEQSDAKSLVNQWVQLYRQGQREPLAFFVKSSEKWALTGKHSEVMKSFNGSSFNQIPGEGDDRYISQVYKDVNQLPKGFETLAEQIFGPLFKAQEVN